MNLSEIAKYVGTALKLQDARIVYAQEKDEEPPIILSRKVIGSVILVLGIGLKMVYGIDLTEAIKEDLTKQLEALVTVAISIYGLVMVIISMFKKKKDDRQKGQS